MLSRWPIRNKLLFGITMLLLIVAILSFSGFRGAYSYRALARSISRRSAELPLAADLTSRVSDLGLAFQDPNESNGFPQSATFTADSIRSEFRNAWLLVNESLRRYREQLSLTDPEDPNIGDQGLEWQTVWKIEGSLQRLEELTPGEDWVQEQIPVQEVRDELSTLIMLSSELPSHLQTKMYTLSNDVRARYRTWIVLTWLTSISASLLLCASVRLFYVWLFRPLRVLIHGSRYVANGDFSHRVRLDSEDEVAELAGAMNDMTARFQEIRDDLDQQVKQRTREVVRSEQLASVGFLAAGVAHEINNPLASVAWCAEALESRLEEMTPTGFSDVASEELEEKFSIVQNYLRKIQDEAFRCKGITERLLDYSRMGDVEKHPTDLRDLVQGVIEMVQHLGKYRNKKIELDAPQAVIVPVNSQEIKQVVLNLITNALDCLDSGGTVSIRLVVTDRRAELTFLDNGCGMTEETLEHLFEPFFTSRPDGQGTGLGLSITYRIVAEHGGTIQPFSDGPGHGSRFLVTLPLVDVSKKYEDQNQAA